VEGAFYTWTAQEIAALGPTATVSPFEDRFIVRPAPADRARFAAARAARPPVQIDDLWLPSTNAQVLRALVRADRLPEALALADEIVRRPRRDLLDDYAPVAQAWLDLLEETADPRWLADAIAEMGTIEAKFADPAGGWFRTTEDGLFFRPRDTVDPSATADALAACLRLSLLSADPRWAARLDHALAALPATPAMPLVADVAELRRYGPQQVVVVWPAGADPSVWRALARATYGPGRIWLMGTPPQLAALDLPVLDGKQADRPTAWVCRAGICDPPVFDPSALRATLDR
jgi:hypothetical protein